MDFWQQLSQHWSQFGVVTGLLAAAVGLGVGLAIGLTGVGGGVLLIPSMTIFLRLDTATAVATAAAYSVIIKSYAVVEHWRLKNIDLRNSLLFLAGVVPGAAVTAAAVKRVASSDAADQVLDWVVLGVILLAGVLLLVDLARKRKRARLEKENGIVEVVPPPGRGRLAAGVGCALLVGVIMGATSIGGGVMVIPVLVFCFKLPMNKTVGSSIFIAVAAMICTTLVFLLFPTPAAEGAAAAKGAPNVPIAVAMGVASLAAVFAGSRLSVKFKANALQALVIALIVIAALMQVLKQLGFLGS